MSQKKNNFFPIFLIIISCLFFSISVGLAMFILMYRNMNILVFIQVNDNGTGMDHNNLKIAFQRHATSKIRNINDLKNIKSLGFS